MTCFRRKKIPYSFSFSVGNTFQTADKDFRFQTMTYIFANKKEINNITQYLLFPDIGFQNLFRWT